MNEPAAIEPPTVRTSNGPIRGVSVNGMPVFKGVRYAAPPTGDHRFKPPRPLTPWGDPVACQGLGAPAIQHGRPPGELLSAGAMGGMGMAAALADEPGSSEDCLFLNLWSPKLDRGHRPVMVWLHGGGFGAGSGGASWYDGEALARRGDVVVVTINHRLDVFGYLQLADFFGPEYAKSGLAGMLDIVQALTWVRDNISAFGGDPGNVTIFGESGGGEKVAMLMALPAAHGLYHKAIIQSAGPGHRAMTHEAALKATQTFLQNAGVQPGDVAGLKALSAEAVSEAARSVPGNVLHEFAPCLDGDALKRHPFDPDSPAQSADVPLLIGTTKDETMTFLRLSPKFGSFTDADVASRAQLEFGEKAAAAVATVKAAYPDYAPTDQFAALWTATFIWSPAVIIASHKAVQRSAPVWMYQLTWETPVGGMRSHHGLDVPLVFDNVEKARPVVGPGAAPQQMADLMSASWLAFARSGNPGTAALPAWPAYDTAHRATMLFDLESHVVDDPNSALRRLLPA